MQEKYDVIAQIDAARNLCWAASPPAVQELERILHCDTYFYEVRRSAAMSLSQVPML